MTDGLQPDEAAHALAEIEQRRAQVVELALVPGWFWWAVAGLQVGLAVAVESDRPLAIGLGVSGFVVGVLAVTGWILFRTWRRAQPRHDLPGPAGVLAILGLVATVLAVALPTGFALEAAGVDYPATVGTAAGGVIMVAGGPLLMRHLRHVMLAGSRR